MSAKSPRGRKPRLDQATAWVDGYRRCWRSRAEKGERIKAPTFTSSDQWYGAAEVVVDPAEAHEEPVAQEAAVDSVLAAMASAAPVVEQHLQAVEASRVLCLLLGLCWLRERCLGRRRNLFCVRTLRISPSFGINNDKMVGSKAILWLDHHRLQRGHHRGSCFCIDVEDTMSLSSRGDKDSQKDEAGRAWEAGRAGLSGLGWISAKITERRLLPERLPVSMLVR